MVASQTRFVPLFVTLASVLVGYVHSAPSPPTISSTSRGPPPLPQYYPTSSQRPPSPTSSLAPTAPIVYSAQRIRPSNSYDSAEYEEPYPSSAHLGTARTTSGVAGENAPENSGFVEPIDFSSLLKDVGSSPRNPAIEIGASSSNPLFASESKDTFAGFFGSSKNPFEELTRLNTASSDHNTRQHNEEDNLGFVDPNVQFRSLFDSTGTSSGFRPQDFLGSKSENVGSDPSKGSQTRAYPSFTYSGRQEAEREDTDADYGRGGSNRYRSSYRQVGNNYNNPDAGREGNYDDDDRISHDSPPTDSYDDDGSYYAGSTGPPPGPAGPSPRGGGGGRDYERATPRYSQAAQETSHSPQTKPRAAESKNNPKCKKVEKTVDYSEDYASFTEPESDYDPSTYQGRYKRQSRQGRQGGRGGAPKRPMTCYVCEDENGRYAEKCSYDSNGNGSPKNGAYFHSESSSYSDNNRRPKSGGGKDRQRRNPAVNRQRQVDTSSSESTTKAVSTAPENNPETAESDPKVIDKRQSGGGYHGDGGFGGGRNQNQGHRNNDGYADPYNTRTGTYQNPSGYEGPPLSSVGGNTGRGGGQGHGQSGGGGFDSDYDYSPATDFEREASSASRDFDFSIPREFDPDVQLRPNNNRGSGASASTNHPNRNHNPQQYHSDGDNRRSGPHESSTNQRDRRDEYDISYNDYLRQNFPESLNNPGFSTPSYSPGSNEFRPNYYHRSRDEGTGNNREHTPEISHSPSNQHGRGHGGGRGFIPDKEHTQPSHNFAPPPGFFSEDSPTYENYENLGNVMKEFSSKSRDGCHQVNKGDMTCYVCRDAKGMNKEECMYHSNDPKNKAMAYHEISEYSNPAVSVLPAPLHATLLGQQKSTASSTEEGDGSLAAAASSLSFASTPKATTESQDTKPTQLPEKNREKITTSSPGKTGDKGKNLRSVKSTRFAHSSTVIVHERTKRSPSEEEYDFDY